MKSMKSWTVEWNKENYSRHESQNRINKENWKLKIKKNNKHELKANHTNRIQDMEERISGTENKVKENVKSKKRQVQNI
jgi:predicted  nucleic acid-binding Zn-ribbon protein